MCACMCVYTCVSQRSTPGIFLSCSPHDYRETGSHTEPRAHLFSYTSCPVHAGEPPLSALSPSQHRGYRCISWARLFLGCWGSELRYSHLGHKATPVPHTHSRILDVNENTTHMVEWWGNMHKIPQTPVQAPICPWLGMRHSPTPFILAYNFVV